MADRVVFQQRLALVAHASVEAGCLEAVRREEDYAAAFSLRVLLCRVQQHGSDSPVALRFVDPEVRDVRAAAPGVAADSGPNDASFVSLDGGERFAVEVAGGPRIELVDAVGQIRLDLGRVAGANDDGFALPAHALLPRRHRRSTAHGPVPPRTSAARHAKYNRSAS